MVFWSCSGSPRSAPSCSDRSAFSPPWRTADACGSSSGRSKTSANGWSRPERRLAAGADATAAQADRSPKPTRARRKAHLPKTWPRRRPRRPPPPICPRRFPSRRRQSRPRRPNLRPRPSLSPPPRRRHRRRRPPPPRASLEERLGARWTVWVGGVATGLGALLLVRYAAEQGYFGPGARVSLLGLLLAVVLLGLGEWLRRAEGALPELGSAAARANAPAVLTGAGVVAAFGSVYAAHALYGFIGAGPGVPGARRASDWRRSRSPRCTGRRSPGSAWSAPRPRRCSFPPIIPRRGRSSSTSLPVAVAAYALARLRRWLWLALATAAGGFAWSFLLSGQSHGAHRLDVYHAALAMLVSAGGAGGRLHGGRAASRRRRRRAPASIRAATRRSRRILRPRRPRAGPAARRVRLRRLVDRRGRRAGRHLGDHRRCRGDGRRRRSRSPARWRSPRSPSGPPPTRRGRSTSTRWSPIGAGRRRSIRRASSASRSPPGSASPRSPPGGCCKANACRRRPPSSTPARRA